MGWNVRHCSGLCGLDASNDSGSAHHFLCVEVSSLKEQDAACLRPSAARSHSSSRFFPHMQEKGLPRVTMVPSA